MADATLPPRPEVMLLLSDIKEQPHEDRLRLILADWLEEHGRPGELARAELIRAGVAWAALPATAPERAGLDRQERRLVQEHARAWLGPVWSWTQGHSPSRGLWVVRISTEALAARAIRALARTEEWAWVEEVRLCGVSAAALRPLQQHPLLASLTALATDGPLGNGSLEALAHLEGLARVTRLGATGQRLGVSSVRALLASPYLGRLRELELTNAGLALGAAEAIAGSRVAGQLERLALRGNALTAPALGALVGPGALTRLTALDLRGNGISDGGACMLATTPGASTLRVLDLSDNHIGPAGAADLANSPHLGGLRSLVLWGNPVGPLGEHLLRARFGPRVHVAPVGA